MDASRLLIDLLGQLTHIPVHQRIRLPPVLHHLHNRVFLFDRLHRRPTRRPPPHSLLNPLPSPQSQFLIERLVHLFRARRIQCLHPRHTSDLLQQIHVPRHKLRTKVLQKPDIHFHPFLHHRHHHPHHPHIPLQHTLHPLIHHPHHHLKHPQRSHRIRQRILTHTLVVIHI